MSNICGHCANYKRRPYAEDICQLNGKIVPYLAERPCFIEKSTFKENTNVMEQEIKTKKCSKCGRELPLDQFSKNCTTADGLQTHCKECQKVYEKERQAKKKAAKATPSIDVKTATRAEKEAYLKERLGLNGDADAVEPKKDTIAENALEVCAAVKVLQTARVMTVPLMIDQTRKVHVTDADLAAELRKRGWEVKCTRTTVVEI